jgi:regulator of RNase E activity RraA
MVQLHWSGHLTLGQANHLLSASAQSPRSTGVGKRGVVGVIDIDQKTLDKFKGVSTPTLATALYKRGLRNQVIQGVLPLGALSQSMVGRAFTLRYIPAREDLNPITVFQDPKHPQRAAVEACPPGHVMVMDSRGDPRAASAGGILVRRLMMRGAAGVVTDGGFRDSAEISGMEIPAFHVRPSAPTNLTLHQAIDVNTPIGCGGAPVFPGDVIVGDADGVIVVPAEIAAEIANEAVSMTLYEDFVVDMVEMGATIIGLYPMTDPENQKKFEAWCKDKLPQ